MVSTVDKTSPFYVPPFLDILGRLVERYRRFWLWLGRLESALVAEELRAVSLTKPVFVCGLARSGSTLLHEVLAAHPGVATHRIKDYPMIFTPFWWRRATTRAPMAPARERPHQDKMMITTESPDSIEEMLWMAFFPRCHISSVDMRLGSNVRHRDFESFYSNHIRKLLLAERATRYVAKANYHVARLPYLLRLFPDARFIIPVRSPVAHIASLVRQQRLFSEGHRAVSKSLAVMQRSGHFEFGLDRRPMNLGDRERVQKILDAWAVGEEVRGWAIYWDMVYRYLAELLESNEAVRAASLIVRFETLCEHPAASLQAALDHCGLPNPQPIIDRFASTIRKPDYYQNLFSAEELALIHEVTGTTAGRWGY